MNEALVVKGGFIFKRIGHEHLRECGVFEVYQIHDDGAESLIDPHAPNTKHPIEGAVYGIEVGRLPAPPGEEREHKLCSRCGSEDLLFVGTSQWSAKNERYHDFEPTDPQVTHCMVCDDGATCLTVHKPVRL